MGNLRSVENALLKLGAAPRIVTDPDSVGEAAGLLLPGVGALQDCVDGLKSAGFDDFIRGWLGEKRPFMGVCLGLQALFERSEERDVKGLGIFPGQVKRFVSRPGLKIPHMGWNLATLLQTGSTFWKDLSPADDRFYFVHSFYAQPEDPALILTSTDYDITFTSAIATDNVLACQFHPEKSQSQGLQLYSNFLDSC